MNGEFKVSQSGLANRQLAELLEALRKRGAGGVAAQAARWIIEELARTPLEFFESRNHLEHLELYVRVGFAGPWKVEFAVHVLHRKVFIREWKLSRRRNGRRRGAP